MYQLSEIQLELAGICNATCVYCTWQKRTVGKKLMSRELAFRILDEAKEMGVSGIRYHGLGESLLHPNLIEVIAHGESLKFNHCLSTNCYKLTGELAEGLRSFANLEIVLAVPWVMHDKFVDVSVANAIDYLTLPSKNRRIFVQMVCHENAKDHYRRVIDTFLPVVERQENAFLFLKQPLTWPNDTPNVGFYESEYANHPKVFADNKQTPLSLAVGCNMPERFLMVTADGTCVPCCVGMDDWGLGSVVGRTLKEVWESPEMETIRQKWRAADDSIPCGKCIKRKDCRQSVETHGTEGTPIPWKEFVAFSD